MMKKLLYIFFLIPFILVSQETDNNECNIDLNLSGDVNDCNNFISGSISIVVTDFGENASIQVNDGEITPLIEGIDLDIIDVHIADEWAQSINDCLISDDSALYFLGSYRGVINIGNYEFTNSSGNLAPYLVKYNLNDSIIWAIDMPAEFNPTSITSDSNFIYLSIYQYDDIVEFNGDTYFNNDISSAHLIKINKSNGNAQYYITDDDGVESQTQIYCLQIDAFQNLYYLKRVYDYQNHSFEIKKIENSFETIVMSITDMFVNDFKITQNGDYIVCGSSNQFNTDGIIRKYNSSSELIWEKILEPIGSEYTYQSPLLELQIDDQNQYIYCTGYFGSGQGQGDFEFGNHVISSVNHHDALISKINFDDGQINWVKTIHGSGPTYPSEILLHDSKLYFSGNFQGSLIIDTLIVNESDVNGGFLCELSVDGSVNHLYYSNGDYVTFNNIVSNSEYIYLKSRFNGEFNVGDATLNSNNSNGTNVLFRVKIEDEIILENLPSGTYVVQINDENNCTVVDSIFIGDGSCGCLNSDYTEYSSDAIISDGSCETTWEEYYIVLSDSLSLVNEILTSQLNQNELDYINSTSSLQQALDTWNTTIDLSEGWNMFGYGCPSPIDVIEGLSNHTESIVITKDNNGSVYMPEFGFNGIGEFTPGFGYQIKITEAIEGFSLCDWYVNDIPEDNIVSLQEEIDLLQAEVDFMSPYFGCTDTLACNYDENAVLYDNSCEYPQLGYDCEGNITEYVVGMEAEGGIVFYVDETGEYGLVSSIEDIEGAYEWGCQQSSVVSANEDGIGFGLHNTMSIINQNCQTESGGISAAQAAINYEINGYSDWYLPSIDELNLMYDSLYITNNNIGLFDSQPYWSSSEYLSYAAWVLWFGDGVSNGNNKFTSHRVRVIRAFGYTQGCMDETACNFNPEANMADGSCEYFEQGFDCEGNNIQAHGGIVFYYDSVNDIGLVSSIEDIEGAYEWGCQQSSVVSANEDGIGFGLHNTMSIINQNCQTESGGISAAQAAINYEINGYSDWYLPSIDELNLMYDSLYITNNNIGLFDSQPYWSSSEYLSYAAWVLWFGDGVSNGNNKFTSHRVRVIRAFGYTQGCMDENACNFNPEANMSDGSCEYVEQGFDCEGNINVQVGD